MSEEGKCKLSEDKKCNPCMLKAAMGMALSFCDLVKKKEGKNINCDQMREDFLDSKLSVFDFIKSLKALTDNKEYRERLNDIEELLVENTGSGDGVLSKE